MLQGIGDYQLFNDILWGQNDMWTSLKVNQIENRSSLVTQSFYFPFKIEYLKYTNTKIINGNGPVS